jgi:hypothetical protein
MKFSDAVELLRSSSPKSRYLQEARRVVDRARPYLVGDVPVINVTAHNLYLEKNRQVYTIPPSGVIITAHRNEYVTREYNRTRLIATENLPTEESLRELDALESWFADERPVIVGSVISSQAYPGRVYSMVPSRYQSNENGTVMRSDKFLTYVRNGY